MSTPYRTPHIHTYILGFINFFTLNRARPGIFIAPYLLMNEWKEHEIGYVLFLNCIVSLLIQTPIGLLADQTTYKRTMIIVSNILIGIICMILIINTNYWIVIVSMIGLGIGYALAYPAIYSITLGIVGSNGILLQVPINETCIHAGNAFFAISSAIVVYFAQGGKALFYICIGMCIATCCTMLMIQPSDIHLNVARGLSSTPPMPLLTLFFQPKIIVFYTSLMLFHFSNASMLPLLAQVLYINAQHGFEFACISVAVAQCSMIVSAALAGYYVTFFGTKGLLMLSFTFIPIRGWILSLLLMSPEPNIYLLISTQVLDGAAGGIFGVVAVLIAEHLSRGTGRFSVIVGTIKTIESLGAAFSNLLGENLADVVSYSTAYGVLSIVGLLPIFLYGYYMPFGVHTPDGYVVEDLSIIVDTKADIIDSFKRNRNTAKEISRSPSDDECDACSVDMDSSRSRLRMERGV